MHEPYIRDARSYVELAESVNGAIPRPVEFDYIWGDALAELDRAGVDLRIINLETSITSSEDYWGDKEIPLLAGLGDRGFQSLEGQCPSVTPNRQHPARCGFV